MEFTVYILYSEKYNKFYIGYTSNLIQRFLSHNQLAMKGWTCRFRPWKVIYTEIYPTKEQAIEREAQLKAGQGRRWIKERIEKDFATTGFITQ